jgi:hypothetical protein
MAITDEMRKGGVTLSDVTPLDSARLKKMRSGRTVVNLVKRFSAVNL